MAVNWDMATQTNPLQGINTGLASLGQALQQQRAQERQGRLDEMNLGLHNLQTQSAQMGIDEETAKRTALIQSTGATDLAGALAAQQKAAQAKEIQAREHEAQKMALEKQKSIADTFKNVSEGVKNKTIDAKTGTDFFHNSLKLTGMDLDQAGAKFAFKEDGTSYFSGPVGETSLFMMNGKPVPYGSKGIVEKARIAGMTPEGEPIFQMDKDTTFKEMAKTEETWGEPYPASIGGKKAMVQKSSRGQVRPVIQDTSTTVKMNINNAAPDEVGTLAKQVADGRLDPNAISKRGGLQQKVYAEVERISPGFNFTGATANAKFATNSGNLTSRALIQGVEPLYTKLEETGKALGNTTIPGVNRVMNWAKEQAGNPEIVAFNNLRDDVVAESERILLGSGVLSDNKYLRAVKNVNSAQSYPQLKAAVTQLRMTVKARLDALDKKPFPSIGGNKQISGKADPLGIR